MRSNGEAPIEISGNEFKRIGYLLIDRIADFLDTIEKRNVTPGELPQQLQKILGNSPLPEEGEQVEDIVARASELLLNHSLFNGHPKFLGYITASAAPIGALADLLAASINPNVGAQILSPISTEIEKQTVKWLAEFIGVSTDYGGILVSGGNMANFTAFLAGRTAKASDGIKEYGIAKENAKLVVYCSKTTHTWIEKAAVLFGLGSKAIRWIRTDSSNKMDIEALEEAIKEDLKNGGKPIMVVGTAGDVSTGVVDNLRGISVVCKKYDLWFHVDGAYGIPAAVLPELKAMFDGIAEADSIALDPHKWLYSPLEAGCTLVKNPQYLIDTFSTHPAYYNFKSEEGSDQNFYEYGLQNSRGFRALKVWLTLQQAGRNGFIQMIRKNIELSEYFFELADKHRELEAITRNLSITTLRYVPSNHKLPPGDRESYLNALNEALLNDLQQGGQVFLSNAIVQDKYCLRACIVNFRTSRKDMEEILKIIVREGKKNDRKLRSEYI